MRLWEHGIPLSGKRVIWRSIWDLPLLALHLHKRHNQDDDECERSQ